MAGHPVRERAAHRHVEQQEIAVMGGERTKRIQQKAMRQGLIVYTGGHYGNVVGIVPPVVITSEQLDTGLDLPS